MDDLKPVAREPSREKRARLRGTFTPTKATGYNRHARQVLAVMACKEGRGELLDAGVDLLEARKEAVNPKRVSVKRMLSQVWNDRAALRKLERNRLA